MLFSSTTLLTFLLSVLRNVAQCAGDQSYFQADQKELTRSPVLDDDFAAWLEETGNARGMKGVAIAVTRRNKDGDGWTTEAKGFGVADRWGTPVTDETLFSIGSNSKLFTALGIGLLTVNESIPIDWDTKVKDILPKPLWALQDPIAQDQADIVDLLSHRTGLPRHDMSYSQTDTPESAVAKLRYLRPSAEFRQTFQYNNQMYILAAHIISHLTGTPFQTYIARNIISPLGMNWTTYNVTEAEQFGTVADGFVDINVSEMENGDRKRRLKPIPIWNTDGGEDLMAGAGGVISNARDMAKWLQALILHGRSPETNSTVIPASVIDKVTSGVTVMMPQGPAPEVGPLVYGMAQGRYTYQGHEFLEHSGATIGHYSTVTRSVHDDLGVAILINTMADPTFLTLIKWRVLENALGLEHIDWNKRYPAQEETITRRSPHPSDGTPSTLPLQELAGVYFNPAYGTLALCSYPPSNTSALTRPECDGLVSEAIQPILNASSPALLAAMPKLWFTHLLLHHNSSNIFDATPILTFPAPFPDAPKTDDDSRPFAISLPMVGSVEFVFAKRAGEEVMHVEGMACKGVWGAGDGVKELKGEGREGAEVWFDRVA